MNILDLLKDKEIEIKTEVGVNVKLTIKDVEDISYDQDLEPPTQANDWWPASTRHTKYKVNFTNGYSKTYSSLNDIKIIK